MVDPICGICIYIYTCKEYGLLIYVNKFSTGNGNGTVVFFSSTGSGTTVSIGV